MAEPFGARGASPPQEISVAQVNHLPIVAHFARRLGLVEIVNELVPTQMEVEPGVIALGLVLDTLSGRSPLYHLQTAFEECDRALLFGQELPAEYFSDDNVGRMLDCFFEAGTQRIFSALSVRALEGFPVSTHQVHFDTTSINLFGDYPGAQDEAAPFKITHGYSKDKRPDLKQFVLSLLCVDGNVPVFGKIEDGNASDKAINHRLLSEISGHMHKYGVEADAFVYIADSAMVTNANLAQLGERTLFISRLPATYNEHERVILAAIEADDWQEVGHIAQTAPTKNRPGASYRLHEGSVTIDGKAYRAVVVHSSAHDRRRLKRLEREVEASRTEIVQMAKEAGKQTFFCHPDAEAAAAQSRTLSTACHLLDVWVEERPRFGPGRPKKGAPRVPVAIDYVLRTRIAEKPEAIAKRRQMAGCFVLLSNVPADGAGAYSAERILRTYKEQHGIEKNFGFLKDDRIVNALFLKRPERIEALGLILLISLLIWRLIERVMRTELEAHQATLPGWDNKPTARPTAYMVTWKFKGVLLLCVGGQRQLAKPLTDTQMAFLCALQVPSSCFTQYPRDG
jgi:transposase